MNNYYDRYKMFRLDGTFSKIPNLKISNLTSDLYITYDRGSMRFDNLSYKYYGDPNYGWLILLANPQYGSMEFSIPDKVSLRIPYPLFSALERYESQVSDYQRLN